MKTFFKRMVLHLKSIKLLFFLPIVTMDILLPITSVLTYRSENADLFFTVTEYTLAVVPVSSILWSMFILREYIEGKGNELLYLGKNKVKFLDSFVPFLLITSTVIIQELIYSMIDRNFLGETVRVFIVCFFYFCLMYFLMFATKATPLSLMTLIAYTIAAMLLDGKDSVVGFLFFFDIQSFNSDLMLNHLLPMLILGLILLVAGLVLNKRYNRFN